LPGVAGQERADEEIEMIVAIVTFKLPRAWSVEEASNVFRTTAPKYLNKPGLIRKHYFVSENGDRAGGIYLWRSRSDADACYTAEWKAMVTEKYGVPPDIAYMTAPVTVDNEKQAIEAT
jgi:hypothetical protein